MPLFQRRHYKTIALVIGTQIPTLAEREYDNKLILEFCKVFKEDNPNFDEKKFKEAIG